jgi:hypothetical protein
VIDQAKEVAFSLWAPGTASDLDALGFVFDTSRDGRLDATDDAWAGFRVWTDANSNGCSEPGELRTMAELDITGIKLQSTANASFLPDGSSIQGLSSFARGDGSTGLVADAVFAYATEFLPTAIAELPIPASGLQAPEDLHLV